MDKATVLIVDDELMVRRVLGDALSRAGYMVELAGSGQEGLERLRRPGIDLVLLDLYLGDIDGVQVMQETRNRWPQLPIIMLTAHGSMASAIAAVRCGASDYLLKPISIEALRESVARVLEKSSAVYHRKEWLRGMYQQMRSFLEHEGVLEDSVEVAPAILSAAPTRGVYEAGPLRVDQQQHAVSMGGQPIEVTPSEFAILLELVVRPGAVVSCLRLVQALNTSVADEEEARQLIRPHIARLRRKLELDSSQPRHLLSIRGVGYRWAG